MTALRQYAGTRTRDVKTRRIRFTFANTPVMDHYMSGDIAMSHLVSLLSSAFPPGEEFFIRSVRRNSDTVTDAVLKKQIAGFIGQEMTHGREHRSLNVTLAQMGYPALIADRYAPLIERIEKLAPRLLPLAITAAAEHYTAVLAERVLTDDELQSLATDPEIKNLLMWHALEELEHKAVAFDVYRANNGPESVRIATMALIFVLSYVVFTAALAASMATDPAGRRHPVRALVSLAKVPRSPLLKGTTPLLMRYLRPGFHPDDMETEDVLAHWHAELFGSQGSLVDHLR